MIWSLGHSLGGKWFEGRNASLKKLIDGKGPYEGMLRRVVDQGGIHAPMDEFAKRMRETAAVARRYGYKIDWHVMEESVVSRLRELAIKERVTDVITITHTPLPKP